MNDSSTRHTLTFTIYKELGSDKNVYFTVVFIMYLASVVVSVSLMLLLYVDASLHKPMYIFLFSLILNGLIGSTAVWPHVMVTLLTDLNSTSFEGCFFQFFLTTTYGGCNFTVLTVMAYDRLVSIFKPLQYHTIMTTQKVKQLLFVANVTPTALAFCQSLITSQIPFCKHTVHRLLCDYFALSSLSCGDTMQGKLSNLFGLYATLSLVALPICFVLLSYVKIIKLILKCSRCARKKIFETCSPHIVIFANFSLATLFAVTYNRTTPNLPREAHMFVSIVYILFPPLLHPVVYGIKNQEIRHSLSRTWKRIILKL